MYKYPKFANLGTRQPNPSRYMVSDQLQLTYVGGPTSLLEFGGVRLLKDPTFDPGGGEYNSGLVTLRKLRGPALSPEALGSAAAGCKSTWPIRVGRRQKRARWWVRGSQRPATHSLKYSS
jgi:hypothetical protein